MVEDVKVDSVVALWTQEIDTYESQFGPWEKRSKQIIDRYRNERKATAKNKSQFNILWSNVQTLLPAIYANPPNPNIDRRFQDDDDLGRYAAMTLERAVSYYVKNDVFDKVMKQSALDRLLPGRGVAWVRYCPVFEEPAQITEDSEGKEYGDEAQADVLMSEDVIPDYVHWKDFGHTWARTWQEVRGVWRIVYMGRAELVKRFGQEIGNLVPLDATVKGRDGEEAQTGRKAAVYEIWDKSTKKALWFHKAMPNLLDEREDPLGLKEFFPCPEPIYATLSNDDLIPTPDYVQYQDQAIELDMITGRISAITKALKIAGVYDAAAEGIDRLLSEGVENKLLPVQQWAMLGGGNGLQGAISFFPLQEIMVTLQGLYQAREQVKQSLYEITGISDIVRGATNASETATAQQIKGQYATLRLDHNQKDVARFSKDLVVIMTEIIAKHFSLDTIKAVSGIKLMTAAEKQQVIMQQQMAQQTGQPPQPLPEGVAELMDLPTWEDVEGLIRNDTARCFRIDIETDSTIKTDQENEKQSRMEFLTAVGSFMQQAVNTPPELQPLAMELLMFGVRGFKVSRELETSFEATMDKMRKAQENPAPPPPDPAVQAEAQRTQIEGQKMQMEGQKVQAEIGLKQQQLQQDAQIKNQEMQIKAAELKIKEQELLLKEQELILKAQEQEQRTGIEGRKIEADMYKTRMDAKVKAPADVAMSDPEITGGETPMVAAMAALADSLNNGLLEIAKIQSQGNQSVIQAIQNPPPRTVIRDASGNIAGVK